MSMLQSETSDTSTTPEANEDEEQYVPTAIGKVNTGSSSFSSPERLKSKLDLSARDDSPCDNMVEESNEQAPSSYPSIYNHHTFLLSSHTTCVLQRLSYILQGLSYTNS